MYVHAYIHTYIRTYIHTWPTLANPAKKRLHVGCSTFGTGVLRTGQLGGRRRANAHAGGLLQPMKRQFKWDESNLIHSVALGLKLCFWAMNSCVDPKAQNQREISVKTA